jgi:hypothetical protein
MNGGRHGVIAAGLARRALWNDRGGRDLRSGNPHRRATRVANPAQTAEQRSAFEDRLSLMRRVILGLDVAVLAVLGYWIGDIIAGKMLGATGG